MNEIICRSKVFKEPNGSDPYEIVLVQKSARRFALTFESANGNHAPGEVLYTSRRAALQGFAEMVDNAFTIHAWYANKAKKERSAP